ncbi:putative lysozyme [Pseudomonas plecoglossicida]|uniref:putative lysozyme n=1 Tax=Pseudomonas plecoglossicida TaxID=70775 RepID=UPI0003437DBF|nr:putative lysozyme [Pseudomonas plecoglossicida NB2011]
MDDRHTCRHLPSASGAGWGAAAQAFREVADRPRPDEVRAVRGAQPRPVEPIRQRLARGNDPHPVGPGRGRGRARLPGQRHRQQPQHAAASAAWFWHSRGLNALAERGDLVGITRKINGGSNGLADRQALWEKARQVLGV